MKFKRQVCNSGPVVDHHDELSRYRLRAVGSIEICRTINRHALQIFEFIAALSSQGSARELNRRTVGSDCRRRRNRAAGCRAVGLAIARRLGQRTCRENKEENESYRSVSLHAELPFRRYRK